MGNRFSAKALGLDVYMTNGSTEVFCDVMALAGSSVARTAWQQNLVLHFCDLVRYALGMGGFDLAEIPWTRDHQAEQDFFIVMLDRAIHRTGWEKLHYTPTADYNLGAFMQMLTTFRASPTTDSYLGDWTIAPKPYLHEMCIRHMVFQGEAGCRLCDPSIQPTDAPFVWEMTSTYTADGTINGETIKRQIWQIPDELIPRIRAVVGNPQPRALGMRIEPGWPSVNSRETPSANMRISTLSASAAPAHCRYSRPIAASSIPVRSSGHLGVGRAARLREYRLSPLRRRSGRRKSSIVCLDPKYSVSRPPLYSSRRV